MQRGCGVLAAIATVMACGVAAVVVAAPSPPLWGGVMAFSVRVNMTNPSPVAYWQFDYVHDGTLKAELYRHYPPQFDEMCADQPYGSDHECDVLFATDGWSYISFPAAHFCCKCENSFGAVRSDWLFENSTYAGQAVVDGLLCDHWQKQGQYLNNYFDTADSRQLPVRFNETWGVTIHKLKQWDFLLDTYQPSANDSLLQPPSHCSKRCTSSVCEFGRVHGRSREV
jgi:hypothetical protein